MTESTLQFQVNQLRQKNQVKALEAIAVFLLALFVTAILPSLLIQYVYANQQLFEQPLVLELIPMVSFVVATAYFIYVAVTNWMREAKAARMEREMMGVSDNRNVADLKAAMANVEEKVSKPTRRTKAKRTTRRK